MNTTQHDHVWFEEQIATYLAGGLAGDERERFESHAADCSSCAAQLESARADEKHLTDLFSDATPPAGFEDRVIAKLRHATTQRRWLSIHPWAIQAAASAAAVLMLGSVGYVGAKYLETGQVALSDASSGERSFGLFRTGRPMLEELEESDKSSRKAHEWNFKGGANTALNWSDRNLGETAGRLAYQYQSSNTNKEGRRVGVELQTNAPAAASPPPARDEAAKALANSGFNVKGVEQESAVRENKKDSPTVLGRALFDGDDRVLLSTDARGDGAKPKENLYFGDALKPTASPGEKIVLGQPPQSIAQPPQTPPTPPPVAKPALPEAPPATSTIQRKIIRNGEMEFEVERFDSAAERLTAIVNEEGGYVGTANSDKLPNGKVRGVIVVRVAPDHLDALVLKLRALGDLKRQNLTAQDVTKQYTDLESELRAAHAMQDRLLEMIKSGKGEIKDLLAAEKELAVWRGKIEKVQGEINYYNNLVSLSTLQITLSEKDIASAAAIVQTETVDMGIETEDVDKSRGDAVKAVEDAKGRIVESQFKQFEAGQFAGRIIAEVPPEKAGAVIDRLKQLGKVQRYDAQRQSSVPSGAAASSAAPASRIERRDTRLVVSLYNLANVAPRTTTNVNLACDDVDKAYREVLERVAKAGGRVVSSSVNTAKSDQGRASVIFEVKSVDADAVLLDVRSTGEVMRVDSTENPDANNNTTAKRGFNIAIVSTAAAPPRQVTTRTIASADVSGEYQKILDAARKAGARVVVSKLEQSGGQPTSAWLDFELRRESAGAIEALLTAAGDTVSNNVATAADSEPALDSKVQLKLGLQPVDQLPPREATNLGIETKNVESALTDIVKTTTEAGGRVIDSNVSRETGGRTTARLVLDVPLARAGEILDRAKSVGTVSVSQTSKNAQAAEGKLSRARIEIVLSTPDVLLQSDRGFWASLRNGLATSASGLMWSLQLVVIGTCLVIPWALALWGGWKLVRRMRNRATPATLS